MVRRRKINLEICLTKKVDKNFDKFDKNLQKELLKAKKRIRLTNQILVDCSVVINKFDTLLKRKNEEIEMLRQRLNIPFRLVENHAIKKIRNKD